MKKNVRQEEREQQRKQDKEDNIQRFKMLFSSEQGKKVLEEINKMAGHGESSWCADSERITTYNLGKQALAIEINKLINEGESK